MPPCPAPRNCPNPARLRTAGFLLAVLTLALAGLTPLPASSEDFNPAAAARGAQVVDQWCRDCHQRPGEMPDADMAPPHEELVMREGRDRAWFTRFLSEDHFPMTTFRLFDHEKADVVDWLLDLQTRGK